VGPEPPRLSGGATSKSRLTRTSLWCGAPEVVTERGRRHNDALPFSNGGRVARCHPGGVAASAIDLSECDRRPPSEGILGHASLVGLPLRASP